MPKRKNAKKAKQLRKSTEKNRRRSRTRVREENVSPTHQEIKERFVHKDKEPHDQFDKKQTSKEVIMGLGLQHIPTQGYGKRYSYDFKLKAVRAANQYGIKPVARRFKIARNTIRSWSRRYGEHKARGLVDGRSGPKNIPHKTSKRLEKEIIRIRRMAPCFGPRRMKYFFDIPCSLGAISRVIRQAGLARPRRQKVRKRNDLRAIKAERHQAFEFLQMDIKYLTDIPFYVKQLKPLALPKFQYTVRDTRSGILFLGYSDTLSELNARTMVDYIIRHFQAAGVNPERITVQTDNGSEFSGMAKYENTATFVRHVESVLGASHRYIRPGNKNAQADVESSHWWIESEFYDLTSHLSRADFLQNAEAYRLFFNLVRPNFSRDAKTPWQIAQECLPNTDITSRLALLPVVDLDRVIGPSLKRGQTIPELAELRKLRLKHRWNLFSFRRGAYLRTFRFSWRA